MKSLFLCLVKQELITGFQFDFCAALGLLYLPGDGRTEMLTQARGTRTDLPSRVGRQITN